MKAEYPAADPRDETMLLPLHGLRGAQEFEGELTRLLQSAVEDEGGADEESAAAVAAHRHRKRRRQIRLRIRLGAEWWLKLANLVLAAAATVIVAMLSVLGGVISYDPLRGVASPGVSSALTSWWPLMIYGPWLVACLSILRAALHQRRVVHSWIVMVFFSALAVGLCVAGAPRTVTDLAVAGLAPVSSLVAFHQLVRQIALVNPPRHAMPKPPRQRG
jgi:uncharacterized protein DUF2637